MYKAIMVDLLTYDNMELDWFFDTEKEAIDFINICLKNGYTMRLEVLEESEG